MTSLQTVIINTKHNYSCKTSIFYFEQEKLCSKDYTSLFAEIETVGLILRRLNLLNTTGKSGYTGVCIDQSICLPTLILGCLQNEKPFVYLDVENNSEFNSCLIKKLHLTNIFVDEKGEKLTHLMKTPRLIESFSIWDFKIQLWETGETLTHTPCEPVMVYAVQTSGTTGISKIVQVSEQAILPNISDLGHRWNVTKDDVILVASPPTFDPFMVELLLAVTSGAAMLLLSPELRVSSGHLLEALFPLHARSLITVAQLTPSVFTRWTPEQIKARVLTPGSTLRVLALGGEKFPSQMWWEQCRAEGNQTQLYNLYGTTEVSCWAMIASGTDGTLGSPLSNTQLRVVNSSGATITDNTGEMYLGSDTRLCLIDEENWKELQPPVFRATGDLVSVKNNRYKFIERKDNLIKRWGHRVSLDYIETIAAEHANVTTACCVLHTDILALYICLHETSTVNSVKAQLRQMLLNRLNKASVPDVILTLDQMPLNKHGKTNKNELKHMLCELRKEEITFKDEVDLFKTLWKKHTCEDLAEDSGFISNGGNSVGAMLIVNTMAVLGFDLPMKVLSYMLNNTSLTDCCKLIDSQSKSKAHSVSADETVEIQDEHIFKKRRIEYESQSLLYVKMKGSTSNLAEIDQSDVELRITWSYNLGKCVDASPTCVVYNNGTRLAIVGSHSGRLAALHVESGTLLWEVQLPDRIESSLTSSLSGSRGLIGCYDGLVYCVSLNSGQPLWSYKTEAMVKGTALVVGNTWIVGSYDYHVFCISTQDGRLEWKQKMDGIVLAKPLNVPHHSLVVVATLAGRVAALDSSTGAVRWSTSLSSPVFSSPCLVEEVVVIAEVDGTLHGLCAFSGNKVWQYEAGGKIFSSLANVGDSVVFGCHDCSVYCVRCPQPTVSPSLVWHHPTDSPVYATPIMVSLHHLATASTAGLISVLDVVTGAVCCSSQLPGEVFSSPVTCDNFVIVGCRDNNVYCIEMRNKIS